MDSTLTAPMIVGILVGYFVLLLLISRLTSKESDNTTFFLAGRKSPWFLVAFGMIGASLSGVTFISIPGVVGDGGHNQSFSYMQMVMGYVLGYVVIAEVLMPLYYKLNLTSIYGLLEQKLGWEGYKIGAGYFLLSRTIGAALRLFLVAIVFQQFIMEPLGGSFYVTVLVTIVLIWVYTYRSGIKTIVYTDALQTLSMLSAVILSIYMISVDLEWSVSDMVREVRNGPYGQMFFFENGWSDPNFFFKQFFSGALITIVMTGMDQDMMQKNLSCRNIGEAKKNMYSFTVILVGANLLFITLGALLYQYAAAKGIATPPPGASDTFFPTLALEHLPLAVGLLFVVGLVAAAYSSADSALTSLTTAFCVDFLGFERKTRAVGIEKRWRILVHIGFSVLLFGIIVIVHAMDQEAIINQLFTAASYTYGPILGLFMYVLLFRKKVSGWPVIAICLLAPLLSYGVDRAAFHFLNELTFGFLILGVNGLLTLAGLYLYARIAK